MKFCLIHVTSFYSTVNWVSVNLSHGQLVTCKNNGEIPVKKKG